MDEHQADSSFSASVDPTLMSQSFGLVDGVQHFRVRAWGYFFLKPLLRSLLHAGLKAHLTIDPKR